MMEEIIREGSLRLVATESSCDVVLSCIGYRLMAHKIILSIASPVLQELLQQDSSVPTVLIFPDISATTMTLILDYIYNGHVSLLLPQVSDFLSIANLLKLKLEEDYLRLLRKKCEVSSSDECAKFIETNLKLFDCYKFERCKYEVALRKPIYSESKKLLPGLIPIEKVRKRGLFNKVFPSPWIPREAQELRDPRIDCISHTTNYEVQNYAVSLNKNDPNNNIEVETVPKPPEVPRELDNTTQEVNETHAPLKNGDEQETLIQLEVNGGEKRPKEKEKPFKCNDCGKSFSQLRNYKYHRSIHDGTKEFSTRCPECGKVFNDRGYLSSHMKIHRDRKEYACQHCPKRFNQRVAYNMHLRIHTGLKPHECSDCGKTFSRKMLLKQHQRVHTGERPYTCAECGKSFADRSNMSLHARLHTGEKPYSCDVCDKSFTKKHHLKTHMNFHTGEKPYKCEKCGVAFTQSSNMRTHYKKCVLKSDSVCTNENV